MIQDLLFNEYAGRGITLQTDDGAVECQVFTVFKTSVDSEQKYIALIEMNDLEHSNRLLLYRFDENEDGPSLENIDNEEEYKSVTDVLNEYMAYLDDLEQKMHEHDGECGCGCGCSSHEHTHSDCDCGSCH